MVVYLNSKKSQQTELEILNVLEKYTTVPTERLDLIINQIKDNSCNISDIEISVRYKKYINVHCTKTGQIIRERSINELRLLDQTIGEQKAFELLDHKNITEVSLYWIYDSPEILEKLFEIDPKGYFVYSLFFILPQCRKPSITQFTGDMYEINKLDLAARIATYEKLNNIELNQIIKTNELMRRYLSVIDSLRAKSFLAFQDWSPELYADNEYTISQLQTHIVETIKNLIKAEFKKNNIQRITYDTALYLETKYNGHSQFTGQRKMRALTESEHIEKIWNDFGINLGHDFIIEAQDKPMMKKMPKTTTEQTLDVEKFNSQIVAQLQNKNAVVPKLSDLVAKPETSGKKLSFKDLMQKKD